MQKQRWTSKYYAKWKEPNTKDYICMILLYKISLKCTSLRKENLPWARMGMRTDMQIGKSELLSVTEIFQNILVMTQQLHKFTKNLWTVQLE